MKRLFPALILAALAVGCGKSTEEQIVAAVGNFDGLELAEGQVKLEKLQENGEFATAELTVTTAVKLRKENSRWVVDEIRLGDRRWEKAERILEALDQKRREAAIEELGEIRKAIERFRKERSQVPRVPDFRALIDDLTPDFMGQVIRFDPWSRPYRYRMRGDGGFDLRSAGPDGEFDTEDDVTSEQASQAESGV